MPANLLRDVRELGPRRVTVPYPRQLLRQPVEVQGDSVLFRPADMALGRFYLAELKQRPYIYRRVSDTEVEIYGLAEDT